MGVGVKYRQNYCILYKFASHVEIPSELDEELVKIQV